MTRRLLAALTVVTALVLAACGTQADDDTAHNGADVTFAQQMVPHHEQAVEMADLALDPARGASTAVVGLAQRIRAAQQPEIDQLTGLLEEWGEDASSGHGGHAGHDMAGMMTDEQMSQLADSAGATFDERWLQMMVEHHEGAVEMAGTEAADGQDADATALARTIVETQQAEIAEMKELLR